MIAKIIEKKPKINLYLLGIKGFESLQFLVNNNFEDNINFVFIGKDKNLPDDFSKKIKELCIRSGLKSKFRNNSDEKIPFAEVSVAISWKWLIKSNSKLLVIHDSILPSYRGYLPLVSQLLDGQTEIGVTAILGNEKFDEGDIVYVSKTKISYPITINEAIKSINLCYFETLKYLFKKIQKQTKFDYIPQDHSKATYSLWRDEDDYFINWDWPIKKIQRFIDSVGYPYKGAKTIFNKREITIERTKILSNINIVNRNTGKFFKLDKGKPIVVCKDGLLFIENAKDRETEETIFPLKSLRQRFRNQN